MSEQTVQTAVRDTIRSLSAFSNADVTINDWTILDGSLDKAPYVIIETADGFSTNMAAMNPVINWQIPVTLFERFNSWKQAYDNLAIRRQAIIDRIMLNAEFAPCMMVNAIRSDSPIGEWFPFQDAPLPTFILQRIILEIEECTGDCV